MGRSNLGKTEDIKKYQSEYRQNNRNKLLISAKKYVVCEDCNEQYQKCSAYNHKKTNKHKTALQAKLNKDITAELNNEETEIIKLILNKYGSSKYKLIALTESS